MPSLADLLPSSDAPPAEASGTPAPSPTPYYSAPLSPGTARAVEVVRSVRGDDLMATAGERSRPSPEEMRLAGLFKESMGMVQARLDEDPGYAKAIGPELERLSNEGGQHFFDRVVDEADRVKIEALKQENPHWFNSGEAARTGFFNSATFGQVSKIIGKAGELLQGRPYEDVVTEQAEKFRLLQKAFPGNFQVGEASAYLMPGSPAKALFGKAAGLVGGAVGKALARLGANPTLLTAAIQSGASGAAGAGAVGAVQGTAGTDLQGVSLDRGLETSLAHGTVGGALGALTPVAGAALKKGIDVSAPYLKSASRWAGNATGRAVEQLSGASEDALRAYNKNPAAMKAAANRQADIGADMVEFLQTQKLSQLPEVAQANQILPQLPEVNGAPVLDYLRGFKPGLNPAQDAEVKVLHEWADRIEAAYPGRSAGGQFKTRSVDIPAPKMREIVEDMQDAVRNQYGKDSPFVATALKQAARLARGSIVGRAGEDIAAIARPGLTPKQTAQLTDMLAVGKTGPEIQGFVKANVEPAALEAAGNAATYTRLMEKAAEKREVLKFIGKQLGSTPEVQQARAEGFIRNVFGRNKDFVQTRMADLDRKFGTNFLELARTSNYASQLGPKGTPAPFSNLTTGKALAGVVTGGALGGAPGALAGQALSSPRAGAALLGASDSITGFVNRMVAAPEVIARLAGRAARTAESGSTPAIRDAAAKQVAQLRVPLQVRAIADQVYRTLTKDGPISAAGTVRVVADSPYFIGLVHYFEVAERRLQAKEGTNAVAKTQSPPPSNVATPRGQ